MSLLEELLALRAHIEDLKGRLGISQFDLEAELTKEYGRIQAEEARLQVEEIARKIAEVK